MCTYPQSDHALTPCKCVLRFYSYCPCINITDQEIDNHYSETTPSIRFHIHHIIEYCTAHFIIILKDKKYITCVNKNLRQINLKIYIHQKRASYDGNNNLLFPYQFLHTSHPKVGLLLTTCEHTWYKSLW